MPVFLKLANLIIAKSTVATKYRGGEHQFRLDFAFDQDRLNQEDNELFAIAAMNCDEFDLQILLARGLDYDEDGGSSDDFVVISRYGGYLWEVDWIVENGLFAWHQDCAREELKRVREVLSLSVAEVQALQKRGESPLGTIRK